tara:strand:- start:177 stop:368 length:192 start_codon:yes stop_codon:yes gene_type:complete
MDKDTNNIPRFVSLMEEQIENYRIEIMDLLENNLYLDIKYEIDMLYDKMHSVQEMVEYLNSIL